jgi:hypothetical protein
MRFRTYRARAAVAAGATAVIAGSGLAMTVTTAAQAATSLPTVTATMSASKITLSGGGVTTSNGTYVLHAGRYRFHVVSVSGDHALQIARFKNGYTAQQAQQDFQAVDNGSVAAVRRIDHGVVFRGGADATGPKHPADMVVTLQKQSYFLTDFNGNANAPLNVTGTLPSTLPAMPFNSSYIAYSYGWGVSAHLPAKGYVRFINHADQPHFLVLQHVKSTTTSAMVSKFIKSGANGNPTWGLRESADSGVLSPNYTQTVKLNLPAGRYLVMCFFPDYFTGMPHFMMGMWKLVNLS